MHAATIIASLGAALAAAAPATESKPSENIDILDFIVRKDAGANGTKIKVVDFKLNGRDAKGLGCTAQAPNSNEVVTCGESKYRFTLQAGADGSEFGLRIYHEVSLGGGFWGQGDVPTYCRAGGDGPNDFVCSQVAPTTIVIQ